MNKKRILTVFTVLFFSLLFAEIVLRVQQKIGPLYDLNFEHISLDGLSDVLNHKPLPEKTLTLSNRDMYGDLAGFKYTVYFDEDGVRQNRLRPRLNSNSDIIRILLMGDSFIQGYDDSNTIPHHIWSTLKNRNLEVDIYNAGNTSYSPAIFIPQAKHLIPKINPDLVVVDIDETDLGDDFIRYRELIVRDSEGKIAAVKASPLLYENNLGYLKIREHPLFLFRFIRSIYHQKFHMPSFTKRFRRDGANVLSFSRDLSENASEKYQQEIAFFRNNVQELSETLLDLMGAGRKVLFIYHPHLKHLEPDSNGRFWNDFVSATIEEVAKRNNITYYNARDELEAAFGGHPRDYYWQGGNIHFNFEGMKVYGELVAIKIISLMHNIEDSERD